MPNIACETGMLPYPFPDRNQTGVKKCANSLVLEYIFKKCAHPDTVLSLLEILFSGMVGCQLFGGGIHSLSSLIRNIVDRVFREAYDRAIFQMS